MRYTKWSPAASSVLDSTIATHCMRGCLIETLPHYRSAEQSCRHHDWPQEKWPYRSDLGSSPLVTNQVRSNINSLRIASLTYCICKSWQPEYLGMAIPKYKRTCNHLCTIALLWSVQRRLKGHKHSRALFNRYGTAFHWQWDIVSQLKLFENT